MSTATFTCPLIVTIPGQLIASSLWNNEFTNIYNNLNPAGMGAYSDTDSQMRTAVDPFPASVISRPTSLQGEIERLRYTLKGLTGTTYWYQPPPVDMTTFKTRFDAHTHDGTANQGPQIQAAGIANATITGTQLAASVAGNGLSGGAGSALSVNVDNSTIETNSDTLRVKDLGITNAKINDVAFGKITGTVTPSNNVVNENHLMTSVAGNGLAGGNGTALSVNVDNSTIEINSDTLRVKALGITNSQVNDVEFGKITGTVTPSNNTVDENKITASVAGNGLAGGAGSALSVNVDNSTLEINSDSLRVKDLGIANGKLGSLAVTDAKVNDVGWAKLTRDTLPCFMARNNVGATNVTGDGTAYTVQWPVEVYDLGSNFASNQFTAPQTGKYLFNASVHLTGLDSNVSSMYITLNTPNRSYIWEIDTVSQPSAISVSLNVIADMDSGEVAYIQVSAGGSGKVVDISSDPNKNFFSGCLIA